MFNLPAPLVALIALVTLVVFCALASHTIATYNERRASPVRHAEA